MLTARIATIVVVQLWRLKKVPTSGKHMWTMLHVLYGDDTRLSMWSSTNSEHVASLTKYRFDTEHTPSGVDILMNIGENR